MGFIRKEALGAFRSDDLIGLGMEADAVRRKLHPDGIVTYILDRNISYMGEGNGADFEAICEKIRESVEMGGCAVCLQDVCEPGTTVEHLESKIAEITRRFPQIRLHGVSAPEILAIADSSKLSARETIARLRAAGLASISSNGVDMRNGGIEDWVTIHRNAHQLGMWTAATMTFGMGESFEQRVDFLEQIRRLQEETGGFSAFIPRSAILGGRSLEESTAVEYLKTLAISRLYLDNIEHVQASWAAQGLKVLQMGLRFGGNDVGSVMPEESGAKGKFTTEEELRRIIRNAGFKPVQRDTHYRTMFLN